MDMIMQKIDNIPKTADNRYTVTEIEMIKQQHKTIDLNVQESSPDPEQPTGKLQQKAKNVILLEDSMFEGLQADWPLKNEGRVTKIKFAPTLQEAKQYLQNIADTNCIMLHFGTNNMKSSTVDETVELTKDFVIEACQKAEQVVLSTIIPGCDDSNLKLETSCSMHALQKSVSKMTRLSSVTTAF
eukprot:Seg2087.8 transcript_id=Seg2087.8/GoldUCD/mRNA.D3Y31 product="hypothetical protein" protein_id=Seg2087.8/GoldUCD/D3Y31